MTKLTKLAIAGGLAGLWGCLLAAVVTAQAGLTVTPAELNLTTSRGRSSVMTMTLLLQSSTPVTGLQIIPLDLVRADGQTRLPAAAIRPALPAASLPADLPLAVPVAFDLAGLASGVYHGDLRFTYAGGGLTVPVTVTRKDAAWWPLLVLGLGVALGLVVSAYRSQGKPRDELLVRLGQVRTEAQADSDLAPAFRAALNASLIEVESALQARNWSAAETAIKQAETLWLTWRKERPDWLTQLAYAAELLATEALKADSRYLKTVRRGLNEAVRDAPSLAGGPRELNQCLESLAEQLSRYLRLRAEIEALNQANLAPAQRAELVHFQNTLDASLPTETDKLAQLQASVGTFRANLRAKAGAELSALTTRDGAATPADLPLPAPGLRPAGENARTSAEALSVAGARSRLAWFTWGGYLIAIILLVGTGFNQLYLAQPAFGANPWGDYFALFLWGFAAEASRAALTDVLRNLDLPGVK